MCHFCRGIPCVTPPAHRDRSRHLPVGEDPPLEMDGPIHYLAPAAGQLHQGQLARAQPAGPAPKPKAPPILVPAGSRSDTLGPIPPISHELSPRRLRFPCLLSWIRAPKFSGKQKPS